jgi:hypothetical protein
MAVILREKRREKIKQKVKLPIIAGLYLPHVFSNRGDTEARAHGREYEPTRTDTYIK